MSAGLEKLRSLPDDEAISLLVSIYMDGVCSGATSGVMTFLMNQGHPAAEEGRLMAYAERQARIASEVVSHGMVDDRLGLEEVINQVEERLLGLDSGEIRYELDVDLGAES